VPPAAKEPSDMNDEVATLPSTLFPVMPFVIDPSNFDNIKVLIMNINLPLSKLIDFMHAFF
jgi:hypothetical protein